MALDFTVKDIIHKATAKFVHAFLPEAAGPSGTRKPYNLRIRLPGEYEGAETSLAEGLYPEVRMQSAAPFRQYIRDKVGVQFDGVDQSDDLIAEAVDEHTGQVDEVMTVGNLFTIRGYGLKIEGGRRAQRR